VAGWAYPDWEGVVYPKPHPRNFHPLAYLLRYFNSIEVNSSFYAIPAPKITQRWAELARASGDVQFTMKLWQGFTHTAEWQDSDARAFQLAAEPLHEAGLLGCILLQFPWSFRPGQQSKDMLQRLLDTFEQFPLAVEIRHSDWLQPDSQGGMIQTILAPRQVSFCNIDQPALNHCVQRTELVTAPHAYFRAHGRNFKCWFQESDDRHARYDYLYNPQEIAQMAESVRALKQKADKVFIITNNHCRGQAVVNALQLRSLAEEQPVAAPPCLVDHFGALGEGIITQQAIASGEQMEMF